MASMFERIAVPIDESDPSRAASQLALEIAGSDGGHLAFCHALDTRDLYDSAATYGYDPRPLVVQMRVEAEDLLDGATDDAHSVDRQAFDGCVFRIDAARRSSPPRPRKASSIIIGTHGRRGLARLFVGSTTEGVLRETEIPLLVVRADHDASLSGTGR